MFKGWSIIFCQSIIFVCLSIYLFNRIALQSNRDPDTIQLWARMLKKEEAYTYKLVLKCWMHTWRNMIVKICVFCSNWNIVESGIKHHNSNPLSLCCMNGITSPCYCCIMILKTQYSLITLIPLQSQCLC